MSPQEQAKQIVKACEDEMHGPTYDRVIHVVCDDCLARIAALAASAAKADSERLRGHQESDAEWVEEYAKVRDERDAFKGAFQIMFNCHHGDETTCGCRDHARSLIAQFASPEARATGEGAR